MPEPSRIAHRTSHLRQGYGGQAQIAPRQWLILACLFCLSLPAVTTRIYSSDEIQYFAYLRSIWFDRDLSFENEYQYFYDREIGKSEGFHETFLERTTDTGRRLNFGTIGCAILWSPFYLAGDVAARVSGAAVDGFSKPYVAAVAYGSAVYGFFALVLAILCAQRLGLNGFVPGLAIWFGTPLLFYMYIAPPFSHACSAFGVALFTYVWLRVRDNWSPRGMAALGAAGALMAMVREQDAFFVAGPALDFAWRLLSEIRDGRRLRGSAASPGEGREGRGATGGVEEARVAARGTVVGIVAAVISFAAVFTPQAASYLVLNGHLGPHSSVAHKMNWMAPHALQVLFSPEHGFFVWTPLALVAIAGLFALLLPPKGGNYREQGNTGGARKRGYSSTDPVVSAFLTTEALAEAVRRNRQIGACLLLMLALQIYVGGSVESWTVAGAFGQRRFIALTTVLVIGMSALWSRLPSLSKAARNGFYLAVALLVYWNMALIAEFSIDLMNRQYLEPRKNLYDALITLPREAPSLAYRYLFDRKSFYKHGA